MQQPSSIPQVFIYVSVRFSNVLFSMLAYRTNNAECKLAFAGDMDAILCLLFLSMKARHIA